MGFLCELVRLCSAVTLRFVQVSYESLVRLSFTRHLAPMPYERKQWSPRRDSNSQCLAARYLKPVRIPVPPPGDLCGEPPEGRTRVSLIKSQVHIRSANGSCFGVLRSKRACLSDVRQNGIQAVCRCVWCSPSDLNGDALRREVLSLLRIPISPGEHGPRVLAKKMVKPSNSVERPDGMLQVI